MIMEIVLTNSKYYDYKYNEFNEKWLKKKKNYENKNKEFNEK